MRFDILTIFHKIFDSYFNESILRRARAKKLVDIKIHNIRDFTKDKHRTTDDKPYGGGAGMVMKAEPILQAINSLAGVKKFKHLKKKKIIILSAKGKQFNQKRAYEWAELDQLILISGRYEGIDERVRLALRAEEISIGPYVLTDGDVAAMVIVSAVSRLLPGVIKLESLVEESHWNLLLKGEKGGEWEKGGKGLEYPHYTRPEVLSWKNRKYRVPKLLLSGNHKKITEWRQKNAK